METWGLIGVDVVAHWWRSSGSLVEMWWLIGENVCWLIGADVVAHCWGCEGSLVEM